MAKRRRRKGEGSVYYRRSDRRWIGDITLNGERRIVSAMSSGEADELLAALRRASELGVDTKGTLAEWATAWLEHPPTRLSDRTLIGYDVLLRRHLLPRLGSTRLRELTSLAIEAALADMARQGLHPGTRHNALTALSSCLRSAVRANKLAANPALGVQVREVQRHRRRWPEIDLVRAREIMDAVANDTFLGDLVPLAFYTGLRLAELLALDWVDVRPGAGQLTVRRAVILTRSGWEMGPTKTNRSWRTVPLTKEAIALLFGRRSRMGRPARGLLFPTPRGRGEERPWTPPAVDRRYKRVMGAAGLDGYRIHDLRHAYATILLSNGAPLATVSQLMGHGQASTTMASYAHSLTGTDRRVVNETLKYWPDWQPGNRGRRVPGPGAVGDRAAGGG